VIPWASSVSPAATRLSTLFAISAVHVEFIRTMAEEIPKTVLKENDIASIKRLISNGAKLEQIARAIDVKAETLKKLLGEQQPINAKKEF